MTKKTRKQRSKRVSFTVSPYVWAALKRFQASGLYGRTMSDAARVMFFRTLRREIKDVE